MTSLNHNVIAPVQHEAAPLRNKIIKALRRAIETGVIEPGTRLVEKELCQQLNVSRTSLREALRQLQAEGILVALNNRGLAVVQISRHDAENIYRIRELLESLIVEQFVENGTESDRQSLREDAKVLNAAYQSGDTETIFVAKRQFYECICAGAGNSVALDLLNKLTLLTSSLRRRSIVRRERQMKSIEEIDAIVEAILTGDKKAAKAAAKRHVVNYAQAALTA